MSSNHDGNKGAKQFHPPTPWIVAFDGSTPGTAFGFKCLRCQTFKHLSMPIQMRAFVRIGNRFLKTHRGCQERKNDERDD